MEQAPNDITVLPTAVRRKYVEYFATANAPHGPKAPGKQPKRASSPSRKPLRLRPSSQRRYDADNLPPLAPLLSGTARAEGLPEKVRRLYLSSDEGGIPLKPHTPIAPTEPFLQRPSTSKVYEPLRYKGSVSSLPAEALPAWENKAVTSKLVPRLHQSAPETRRPSDISDRSVIMDGLERRHKRTSSFKRTISFITDAGSRLTPGNSKPLDDRISWRNPKKDAESLKPVDSPSNYYNDPETRMRLKVCLSSPQKFEEALIYGFPTSNAEPTPSPQVPPRPRRSVSSANDAQKFLRNNTLSFLYDSGDDGSDDEDQKAAVVREYEDTLDELSDKEVEEYEDDDKEEYEEDDKEEYEGSVSTAEEVEDDDDEPDETLSPALRSPLTPRDAYYTATAEQIPFRRPSEVVYASSPPNQDPRHDSLPSSSPHADAAIAPLPRHSRLSRYAPREMTLRMTLTKPELRADEERERERGWLDGGKNDPLALQPLAYFENVGLDVASSTKTKALWWRRKSKQMR